jgi:hypothetical protein
MYKNEKFSLLNLRLNRYRKKFIKKYNNEGGFYLSSRSLLGFTQI